VSIGTLGSAGSRDGAILRSTSPAPEPSKLRAPGFGCHERCLRPGTDHLAFVLGHGRQDVDGKAVRLREVDGYEVDPALHQVGHEGDIAGEAIEFRDDEGGTVGAAECQSLGQAGPIGPLAALHLHELGDDRAAGDISGYRSALRLEPETGASLTVRADAQIAHELAGH
jgi:hypothetical protein